MATLALQIAGSALGSALGGSFGSALGSAFGGAFGAMIDQRWMGGRKLTQGPRLNTLTGITAAEGAAIPRIYGRVRLGGQVIWATEFEEEQRIEKSGRSGGKSSSSGAGGKSLTYLYYANVAIALCEGPVSLLRRIWADGKELDLAGVNIRFYPGDDTQTPDPLIVAKQESADVPAFRGLAYVVLERFALADYGNRLPQFAFEVVRAAPGLPERLRAINLIPGATEFGYAQGEVREDFGFGSSRALNRAQMTHPTDWDASISDLLALAPNLERATLVSSWFGDDLRVGHCTLRPKVEKQGKTTAGAQWSAAGLTRASAQAVSLTEGRPSYGGSPSDESIIGALRDLKARGLKVALHPFILMDIPAGNSLPDPYSGAPGQPAFPWRGRISCDPAPGQAGSPEGSSALESQINAFVGTAQAAHFALNGDSVSYSGPAEWSLRRMVLHHAMLAKAAGGVDTFILASELVGLTHCAGPGGSFPFVAALTGLLAELRAILGPTCTLTYAADWSEYGARVRNNGQEVRFPLDPLWAHAEIGAIGIDFYPPLSDWRSEGPNLDADMAPHGAASAYLRAGIAGGEAFDFYYADAVGRAAQARLPIADGAYGKPWVFRAKDLAGFWSHAHVERVAGVELASPTGWVARSKPIFLTEVGCPAVARGANQPNVFPDAKSSENALPHFSSGARDDLVQRRLIEAYLTRFDPDDEAFSEEDNPLSPLYGGRMVEPGFIAPWAWDVRPYPAFPRLGSLWSDGVNWLRGHWLNGRLEGVPLRELVGMISTDFELEAPALGDVEGFVSGYLIDRPMSARAALEPLVDAFSLTVTARAGVMSVLGAPENAGSVADGDLVPGAEGALVEIARAQASELPARLSLGFVDDEDDFKARIVTASAQGVGSRREAALDTALFVPRAEARRIIERRLARVLSTRERFNFRLPPGTMALEAGDRMSLPTRAGLREVMVTQVTDQGFRAIEAVAHVPAPEDVFPALDMVPGEAGVPALPGAAFGLLLELPLAREGAGLLALALRADPWRGPYAVIETTGGTATLRASVTGAARLGQTMAALPPGPLWRWDHAASLDVTLAEGALASQSEASVLAGGTPLALIGPDGIIEIILFREAVLTGLGRYRLSGLLRGLGGSEGAAARQLPPGATVVVLDETLTDPGLGADALGQARTFAVLPAGRDPGDASQLTLSATLTGAALVPLAPVQARARREAGGVAISFIRRTRSGGDSWEAYDVPLGETAEAYSLEVLSGAQIKRAVSLTMPGWLYAGADELADFGAPQTSLRLRIRQVSEMLGPGAAFEADVPVR